MGIINGYGLCENLKDYQKWLTLLKTYLEKADFVEFNTLFDSQNLNQEIQNIKSDLVGEGIRKDKIFSSGVYRRFKLTEKVKDFILSKKIQDWKNYQFEDLSLLKNGVEILATITHEDYIFVLMDEHERKYFNDQGYDFGELNELKYL